MNDVVVDEIFKDRIIKSNIFNEKEKKRMKKNYLLYKKCYLLGILDKAVTKFN